jgi:hypothetical protein
MSIYRRRIMMQGVKNKKIVEISLVLENTRLTNEKKF